MGYGHEGTDGEQNHAWYELYLQYQKIFEELLQSFLDLAGATVDAFMAEAQQAVGMNEIYLQVQASHLIAYGLSSVISSFIKSADDRTCRRCCPAPYASTGM